MAAKAPKVCSWPRCGRITHGRYCDEHQQQADARAREKYLAAQVKHNAERAETDQLYKTERWRKLRAVFLRRHPLCVQCQADGYVRPAEMVDHIVPVKARPELFFEWSNLRPLCKQCHNRIGEKVRRG